MSIVTVRRVRVGEAANVRAARLALLREEKWRGHLLREEETWQATIWAERVRRGATSDTFATFAALAESAWIGIIDGLLIDATTVDVAGMWVHPQHRRQAIGRALLEAVTRWARERGASRLGLWVVTSNEPARSLYEAAGFTPVGAAQTAASLPSPAVQRMARELRQKPHE